MEFIHSRNAFVLSCEFKHILVDDPSEHERIYQAAVLRHFDVHVRRDATAVSHDSS